MLLLVMELEKKIKGISNLVCSWFPSLDGVLMVEALIANLINISQLCDQGLNVYFNKSECIVTSNNQEVLMKRARSKDMCYMWIPQNKNQSSTWKISKEDEVKLWHKKLGHLNLNSMKKIIFEETIKGLAKLKHEEGKICGECQIGKHTKMSHMKLQHLTIS